MDRCAVHTVIRSLAEIISGEQFGFINRSLVVAIAEPIFPVVSFFDPSGEARILPFMRTPGKTMLDRIEVNVIHVPYEIIFVSDSVLPESFLPDSAFAMIFSSL